MDIFLFLWGNISQSYELQNNTFFSSTPFNSAHLEIMSCGIILYKLNNVWYSIPTEYLTKSKQSAAQATSPSPPLQSPMKPHPPVPGSSQGLQSWPPRRIMVNFKSLIPCRICHRSTQTCFTCWDVTEKNSTNTNICYVNW